MLITSIKFIVFLLITLALFYLAPKRLQWPVLLGASLFFYLLSPNPGLIIFLLISILTTWLGALLMEKKAGQAKIILILTLLLNFGILAVLKYTGFFLKTPFLLPLGLSFYTFQLTGYLTDVYRGVTPPQKNLLKYALFCSYFPQLSMGPIGRYSELSQELYRPKAVDYSSCFRAILRICFGYFKKLVISDRLGILVDAVFGSYASYDGGMILLAAIAYALQLYTDFSGYMDIVLGISELFGIRLAENFEAPFFSKSISEFWRRWHITLGTWLKDYLFYPLLKSKLFQTLNTRAAGRFGKKRGRKYTTYLAMFILWFSVGLWHGADWKFVFGVGLFQWLFIVTGELASPLSKRLQKALHIETASGYYHCFSQVRTFFLMTLSFLFFRAATFADGFLMAGRCISSFSLASLLNGGWQSTGLSPLDLIVLSLSLLLLGAADYLSCHHRPACQAVFQKPLYRFCIYYFLVFSIIIFGIYGTGYDGGAFIYGGF